jgi:thiamine biosynthesis lipoprotein
MNDWSGLARREARAMASPLRLVTGGERVDEAWSLVLERVAAVEGQLTRFDPRSALSRVNRAAGTDEWIEAPRTLMRAVTQAHRGYRLTGGRFDPRIIGALEALGERAGVPLPRSPETLGPDERWLEVDCAGHRLRVSSPIDLGGMGKGFAIGEAARALEERGIGTYLIESGGDVVSGQPPAAGVWRIAVEHPDRDLPAAVIRLTRGALATSSLAVRKWSGQAGSTVHHLLDPATGRPANEVRSVTVHAAHPVWAEIWSTSAFVRGARIPGVAGTRAAWWIDGDGELQMTPVAEAMVAWR